VQHVISSICMGNYNRQSLKLADIKIYSCITLMLNRG